MQITYRDQRDQVSINIDISLPELQFLRQHEPVAWAELVAGIARVGFVLSSIDTCDKVAVDRIPKVCSHQKYGQNAEVP